MKIITLPNRKGGVGKSAILCQFAYYLRIVLGLRVLVVDLDHQSNASAAIKLSGLATVSATLASKLMTERTTAIEKANFVLVVGDEPLLTLERQADKRNAIATNLHAFLRAVGEQFDVCLIDTNPNPDIRLTAALVVSGYVLSPVELNQEALDGIGALYSDVNKVKAALNPNLKFIGILPNLVEPTPFQAANFKQLAEKFSALLIRMKGGGFAKIKTRTAIAEAQAGGLPVWQVKKTSAADCWRELKPVFETIADAMEVRHES
jgi:chromosome partitioning protein